MVRDKTVLTYHKIYIPSIYMFYIMCVSSILISAVLCLYSKISVVVVNNLNEFNIMLFSP